MGNLLPIAVTVGIVMGCCPAVVPAAESGGTQVSPDQFISLLQMMASQSRGNFDRIESASGAIDVVEVALVIDPQVSGPATPPPRPVAGAEIAFPSHTLTGKYFAKQDVRVRFAFDQSVNKLFTSYRQQGPLSYKNLETGAIQQLSGLPEFHEQTILTPEHYLHHMPNARVAQLDGFGELPLQDEQGHRLVYRDAAGEAERYQRQSFVVDPRDLFKYSNRFFFEHHERNAQSLRSGVDLPIEIRQLPGEARYAIDRIYYANASTRTGEAKVTQVVDGSVGFNTTEASMRVTNSVSELVSWQYKHFNDGIYFPSSFQIRKYNDENELVHERRMTLVELKLNEPIDKQMFTEAAFDLADGDRLLDRIENKVALYHQGEAVHPEVFMQKQSEARTPQAGRSWIRWCIITIIAGICVFCIVWSIRQDDAR